MEITSNSINQDLIETNKSLKIKVYDYFYNLLNLRKEPKFIALYIFHTIEIIQLISFAFSPPHSLTWNISETNFKYVSLILSGFRLTPLCFFISLKAFSVILVLVFFIIIVLFIFLIIQILFRKENSKIYSKFMSFTLLLFLPLRIILVIPFMELFLISFKCKEEINYIRVINWGQYKCWSCTHIIHIILGVIGIIVLLLYLYVLNYYYFYPFFVDVSTTRLNSTVDERLIIIKFIYIIQYVFIKNEYISIAILLILSIILIYSELKEPIFNSEHLELFLNIRNIIALWTYFILLIAKICHNHANMNNIIYLVILGYPLIIYCFIMFFKEKENDLSIYGDSAKFKSINSCLANIRLLTKLINSFVKEHSTNINSYKEYYEKDIIILKGIIEIHTNNCLREECPLTKFIQNEGNFNMQKQALLNYMSFIFNQAIKTFPQELLIRIYQIQFNYDHKYNLISIKETFEEMRKMQKKHKTEYVIYCQEMAIISMSLKSNIESEELEQSEKLILEQGFQRMKKLISNTTKLFAEFWGIFEAKVTNNLNIQKLYVLGEKINIYMKELSSLWENELKNKKLNTENESVAQLYSLFLREIVWDKKRSDLVQKKINEEHYLLEFNKGLDDNKKNFKMNSLEIPEYIIFIRANEKGNCTLVQFSNSLCHIIGYERHEILNKPFEILLPAIYNDSFSKKIENYIKTSLNDKKGEEKIFLKEMNKNKSFILIKNKMGYINQFYVKFKICEDNDFSDNTLIRMKLENVDTKSMYAFYILTKSDFSVESISSSAIHLGLSMDLLKKYVIKLNVLIRTYSNKSLNLFEKYEEFLINEKKITWVFPDVIYPKDNSVKNKERNLQDLINESKKSKFNLQIIQIKNQSDEINGFIFKIYDSKKNKKENINQLNEFIPSLKNQIIFDLLNLKYIRTVIVNKKSGFRNLRTEEENNKETNIVKLSQRTLNSIKKIKEKKEAKEESSDDEEIHYNKITKEKLLELQTKDSNDIKYFINRLSFYGKEISLIKHRPNKEKYSSGKAQEPLIKISLNDFTKRISAKIKDHPLLFKKTKSTKHVKPEGKINITKNDTNNNIINEEVKKSEVKNEDIEGINKDLLGETSLSLKNIVNANSLSQIKLLDFLIYLCVMVLTIVEYLLANNFFRDQRSRYKYFKYSYDLLDGIVYIQYFLTEGVFTVNTQNYSLAGKEKDIYLNNIKQELSEYHKEFLTIFAIMNNPDVKLSQEFNEFKTQIKVEMKTWNNGAEKTEYQPLQSAQTKLMNALIYISNSSPEKNIFSLDDKYIYELLFNLLSSHYVTYEKIIFLMIDDFNANVQSCKIKSLIILLIALIISIVYLYIFWNFMIKLDNDREKPVNLFLTIKNKIFENLKNSSENFSNKLLNKFFGVEENEEEQQIDYITNVKPNDINITKFLSLNEYKESNNKGNSFIFYYIQLIIFFVIFNLVMVLKYNDSRKYANNINDYIKIYNATRFTEISLMTRIDITKQYFENPAVGNYEYRGDNNINNFIYGFISLSKQITNTIQKTSNTTSFLSNEYREDFKNYFYHDYSKLINSQINQVYWKYGFKTNILEIFEMLRFLYIKYFIDDERDIKNKNISKLINHKKFLYLDLTIKTIFRPWCSKMIELIDSYFYSYVDYQLNTLLLVFIISIILISIFYWIIWKRNEEEFIDKIEKSFDLINLIPEEIKDIIVAKLNQAN